MVKYSQDKLFEALADSTRRNILLKLNRNHHEFSVSEIVKDYPDMSFVGVYKHINVLADSGLIAVRKEGREKLVRANPRAILEVQRYIDFYTKFWSEKFDKLEEYFNKNKRKEDEKNGR